MICGLSHRFSLRRCVYRDLSHYQRGVHRIRDNVLSRN